MIKTIGTTSATLLMGLQAQGKDFFDLSDAEKVLPAHSNAALRSLLSKMVQRGLLMRLREGLYHVIPYDQDPETYFPDWHLTARCLARDTPYYIGYYSALTLHDLTTQPSFQEQVVVAKTVRPAVIEVKGVSFQFIYHKPEHFFGATRKWVTNTNQALCSDLEKTLLDCAFRPDYGGGIVEIAKAIYKAKANIRPERLLDYARRFGSDAAVRRIGMMLETLGILPDLSEALRQLAPKNGAYVAFDTALPKEGKSLSRWGIIQNIDLQTIQSSIFS